MSYKSKKKYLIAFVLTLPILIFTIFFLFLSNNTKRGSHTNVIFKEVETFYKNKDFHAAASIINSNPYQLLSLENGCDLVISVFAELKSYEKIIPIAKKCIETRHKSGIAFEALGFSYVEQGKVSDGITILRQYLDHYPHDRGFSSLLELSLLNKDIKMARDVFLELLDGSQMWQSWLSRYLKKQELFEDKSFFMNLLEVLKSKEVITDSNKIKLENIASSLEINFKSLYKNN